MVQQKKFKTNVLSSEGGSAYCPENEEDRESNAEEDIVSSKVNYIEFLMSIHDNIKI